MRPVLSMANFRLFCIVFLRNKHTTHDSFQANRLPFLLSRIKLLRISHTRSQGYGLADAHDRLLGAVLHCRASVAPDVSPIDLSACWEQKKQLDKGTLDLRTIRRLDLIHCRMQLRSEGGSHHIMSCKLQTRLSFCPFNFTSRAF